MTIKTSVADETKKDLFSYINEENLEGSKRLTKEQVKKIQEELSRMQAYGEVLRNS